MLTFVLATEGGIAQQSDGRNTRLREAVDPTRTERCAAALSPRVFASDESERGSLCF